MMGIGISAISYCVPEGRLTNAELGLRFGADIIEKITGSSGIYERRVASEGECASDLAERAARALFERGIDPAEIDLVIFATQTPDYLLPTTACLLQQRLGIPKSAAAFDINLGCSQFVYSLAVAQSLIKAGHRSKALVMTGDTVSKILHPHDRAVVPLFGDAGTATIVEELGGDAGFQAFDFGTDGAGGRSLIWPTSGLRKRPSPETAEERTDKYGATRTENDMYMDGSAVFVFTLKAVPTTVNRVLDEAGLTSDDIDMFIFHQASRLIVESAAKHFKLPPERYHMHFGHLGNSGGSTVAICFADALKKERVKPGSRVLLAAFGVGLSWASTVHVCGSAPLVVASVGE
jgi:3-oxoacyl-[acyl-carrier-protein] synthase-3